MVIVFIDSLVLLSFTSVIIIIRYLRCDCNSTCVCDIHEDLAASATNDPSASQPLLPFSSREREPDRSLAHGKLYVGLLRYLFNVC